MQKNKTERILEEFDNGKIAERIDEFPEVEMDFSEAKSVRRIPLERPLLEELKRCAKEKKTTVEKLINALLKKSILKTA